MGIKTLFRKSNSSNLKAQAYDSHVASDPPIRGTFPVAGNGPNVLDDLERSHIRRTSVSSVAPPPDVPRTRYERPRTAPQNGLPTSDSTSERTWSGISMNFPSGFLSNRRNSIGNPKAKRSSWYPKEESPSFAQPKIHGNVAGEIKTYQPTRKDAVKDVSIGQSATAKQKAPRSSSYYPPLTNSISPHSRSDSQTSYRSHVDMLNANSKMYHTNEVYKNKTRASALRDYGEDIADRNIAGSGERDSRIDFDSPDLNHTKRIHSPRQPAGVTREAKNPQSRSNLALDHILGDDNTGDDTQPRVQSTSQRSSAGPKPKTLKSYPPRTESASSHVALRNARVEMQRLPPKRATSSDSNNRKIRPTSSSSTHSSTDDDCVIRYHKPLQSVKVKGRGAHLIDTPHTTTAPEPDRGRSRTALPAVPSIPVNIKLATSPTSSPRRRIPSNSSDPLAITARSLKDPASNSIIAARKLNRSPSQESYTLATSTKQKMSTKEAQQSPKGAVDLKGSTDTTAVTKTLSGVTHEHIVPTVHKVKEEQITREVHNYDVYHRVLPVIDTVVLPTKHYVRELDGSITEIPESMLSQLNIVRSVHSRQTINEPYADDASSSSGTSWTVPVPTLQPNIAHSIRSLSASPSANRSTSEPFSTSKLQSSTSKVESPNSMPSKQLDFSSRERSEGDPAVPTVPYDYYSSENDSDYQLGAETTEGHLLFRNTGYGGGGMLPGLAEHDPASTAPPVTHTTQKDMARTPRSEDTPVGEATLGLSRLKDGPGEILNGGHSNVEHEEGDLDVKDAMQGLTLN